MVSKTEIIVQHKLGLHARPAALFVKTAQKFKSQIQVKSRQQEVNAKSILNILSLAVHQGMSITVTAEGSVSEIAVAAIKKLVQDNFGEPNQEE